MALAYHIKEIKLPSSFIHGNIDISNNWTMFSLAIGCTWWHEYMSVPTSDNPQQEKVWQSPQLWVQVAKPTHSPPPTSHLRQCGESRLGVMCLIIHRWIITLLVIFLRVVYSYQPIVIYEHGVFKIFLTYYGFWGVVY